LAERITHCCRRPDQGVDARTSQAAIKDGFELPRQIVKNRCRHCAAMLAWRAMVKDLLSLSDRYRALGPRFVRAFEFAKNTDFA
jgi:hypothetical protein